MGMNSTLETVRKYLYWNGSIRLGDIQRITGYGKTKANQIFIKIKDELGGQIEKKGHTYYLDDDANLSFDSNEFLDDFYLSNKRQKPFYFSVPSLVIDPMLETNMDNEIIKTVLHALKNKLGIELDYVDAKRGATKERRTVFPLTLCYINERWHFYGFCNTRKEGRDFVLHRILTVHDLVKNRYDGVADSIREMKESKSINIAPHPDLSEDQKIIIRRQYRFAGDTKTIHIPRHQVYYFRKKYLADVNEGPPDKFLIEPDLR